MNRRFVKAMLACALIAAVVPASAVSAGAKASMTNIRFEITDLDLNDGVDASYAFIPNSGSWMEGYLPTGSVADAGQPWTFSPDPFATISDVSGDGMTWSYSAAIGPDSLTASAFETRPGAGGHGAATVMAGLNHGSFEAPILSRLLLVVTPHTQLTITADLAAEATTECSPADLAAYNCRAVAWSFVQFVGAYALGDSRVMDYSGGGVAGVSAVNNGSEYLTGAETWAANPNDESVVLSFQAYVYADSSLYGVTAVPEPATGSLAILGLGAVAWAARRRKP